MFQGFGGGKLANCFGKPPHSQGQGHMLFNPAIRRTLLVACNPNHPHGARLDSFSIMKLEPD